MTANHPAMQTDPAGDLSDSPVSHEPVVPISTRSQGPVSGAAMIIGTKLFSMAAGFASLAIVARVLTPADYGLVAMVVTVTSFLSVFGDLGLSYVTIQRPQITQEQLSALFWANVAFGATLGAIAALLAPVLVWFYKEPRLLVLTLVMAANFPLAALGVQHMAILQRHMQFLRFGAVQIVGTVTGAVIGVVLALLGWGYWALVLQSLMTAVVSTAAAWLSVRWLPGAPRRCKDLRSMLGFGGRLTAHGMIGYLSLNFDKLLLGRFCGPLQLGLYSTPYMLLGRLMGLSAYSVGQAAVPAMSRAQASSDEIRNTYRRMLQLTSLLGLPLCMIGVVWGCDVVLTVLGSRWVEATIVLQALFLGSIPRMISASTGWIYVATGNPGRMLRWEIVQSPLMAVAYVLGLPYMAKGVALGFAISCWVLLVPGFAYCLRNTPFRASDVIRPVIGPLLCAAAGCFVGYLGQMMILPDLPAGAARFAVRMAIGGVTYWGAALLFVPLVADAVGKAMLSARRA